jgi:hypothetical protein
MSEKETSDFAISRVECPHCKACWIDGKHYWSTGATSDRSEIDLAGLVCNTQHGDPSQCINPQLGNESGDSWSQRLLDLYKLEAKKKEL